jgi:hypothetical protein
MIETRRFANRSVSCLMPRARASFNKRMIAL